MPPTSSGSEVLKAKAYRPGVHPTVSNDEGSQTAPLY